MYKSPVEIIFGEITTAYEDNVFKLVQNVIPDIDKDELIKALQYDRQQYKNGYIDGATEFADRLKKWFVENSNYWFSYTVNAEIDDVLNDVVGVGER